MKYPFKVIVKGKVYGEATTLAEAEHVAKVQGGYVARIANPDLLTGKIRQREDGGHYVRTRKDKRPAEVDITADQVAGDWRTQLAHSGHAPAPKPSKAPKVRAPKAARPKVPAPIPQPPQVTEITAQDFYRLGTPELWSLTSQLAKELLHLMGQIQGFCAALLREVNFTEASLPQRDFRKTPTTVQDVAKALDYDLLSVGYLCWRLLNLYGAKDDAAKVRDATIEEMRIEAGLSSRPEPVAAPQPQQDERYRHRYAAENGFQVVEDTDVRFEAVGPNGMLKIKKQPGFDNGFIAHLFSSKGRPLEYGSSDIGGTMDQALADLH